MDKQELIRTAGELRALDKKVLAAEKAVKAALGSMTPAIELGAFVKSGRGPGSPSSYDARALEAAVLAALKKGGADGAQARQVWEGYRKTFDRKVLPQITRYLELEKQLVSRYQPFDKACDAFITRLKADAKEVERLRRSVLG